MTEIISVNEGLAPLDHRAAESGSASQGKAVLVVATSPLQIQNAIQYVEQHEISFDRCVLAHVASRLESDNVRALSVATARDWRRIESFEPFITLKKRDFPCHEEWVAAERRNRAAFIAGLADFFETLGQTFDVIALGDYRPLSFRQFLQFTPDSAETVLLDDGSIARYVMEFRAHGREHEEVVSGLLPYLGADDPFKMIESSSLTFFTIYQQDVAQSDRIIRNKKYDAFDAGSLTLKENEIWICGANHCEARLARQDKYLQMCKAVRRWFPEKKIVYFPHRRETAEKVALICDLIGADASSFAWGIEEYVLQHREKPERLVVFGSTVADTLGQMFAPEQRIVVAAPQDGYFTSLKRVRHVKNVIIDNIRRNDHVLGLDHTADGLSDWARATPLAAIERGAVEYLRPSTPPQDDPRPEGLSIAARDGVWTRYRENSVGRIHRLVFGDLAPPRPGEAYFHVFKVRSEGRHGAKIRLADAAHGKNFVEARVTLDVPSVAFAESKFGAVAVEVEVDEQRISTVSLFFAPKRQKKVALQFIMLSSARTNSSFHEGRSDVGLSLARVPALDHRFLSIGGGFGATATAHFALTPSQSALVAFVGRNTHRLACLHAGLLDPFEARELVMPFFGGLRCDCLSIASPDAERPPSTSYSLCSPEGQGVKDKLREELNLASPLALRVGHFGRLGIRGLAADEIEMPLGERPSFSTTDVRTGRKVVLDAYHDGGQIESGPRFLF